VALEAPPVERIRRVEGRLRSPRHVAVRAMEPKCGGPGSVLSHSVRAAMLPRKTSVFVIVSGRIELLEKVGLCAPASRGPC